MYRPVLVVRHPVFRALAVLASVGVGLAACEGCRSIGQAAAPPSAAAPAGEPTVRLYFVSDMAGALEPCGCTEDQLGGLGHFGAWVRRDARAAGDGAAALVASAGPLFFMDEQLAADRADQDRAKAETIARVLGGLDLAAFAPGVNDWAAGRDELARLAGVARAAAIAPGQGAPFVSEAVRDAGGLRVGFVGYAPAPGAPEDDAAAADAVRRGAARARKDGANVLVALVSAGRGEAKRIADAVPELTAVVVGSARSDGDANTTAPQGERVGDVLIAQGANHLQSVAELDLYVREAVAPGRLIKLADATGLDLAEEREAVARRIDDLHVKIAAWERAGTASAADLAARRADLAALEARRDALDRAPPPRAGSFFRYSVREIRGALGEDPAIEQELASYYKAANDHNRAAFADRLPPPLAPGQAGYVGVDACTKCHAAPRHVWDATKHARAYATLSSQLKEYNLDCVGCHVTGYEKPGGSAVAHVDGLKDVQCEVCHGPGSLHVRDPTDPAKIVGAPPASVCLGCHHPPHVDDFDVAAAMQAVLGPGHGR